MTTLDNILTARTANKANDVFGVFAAAVDKAGTVIMSPEP